MITLQRRCGSSHAICLGLAIGLLLGGPLVAQVTTGSISGVVTDTTGALIAAADVAVRDVGTNIERTVRNATAPDCTRFPICPSVNMMSP